MLGRIRHRVQRLLVRRGLEPGDEATGPADRLAEESAVLAGIVGASVQGRVALGARAGPRVRRRGDARDTPTSTSRGPRQAHREGFDLHANVRVGAHDRAGGCADISCVRPSRRSACGGAATGASRSS